MKNTLIDGLPPNRPTGTKRLSEVSGTNIGETLIGSCITCTGPITTVAKNWDATGIMSKDGAAIEKCTHFNQFAKYEENAKRVKTWVLIANFNPIFALLFSIFCR